MVSWISRSYLSSEYDLKLYILRLKIRNGEELAAGSSIMLHVLSELSVAALILDDEL